MMDHSREYEAVRRLDGTILDAGGREVRLTKPDIRFGFFRAGAAYETWIERGPGHPDGTRRERRAAKAAARRRA